MGERTKRVRASGQLRLLVFVWAAFAVLIGGILLARRSTDSGPDSVIAVSPTAAPYQDGGNSEPRPLTATVNEVFDEDAETRPVDASVAGWERMPGRLSDLGSGQ